jgi:LPS-assembly protein
MAERGRTASRSFLNLAIGGAIIVLSGTIAAPSAIAQSQVPLVRLDAPRIDPNLPMLLQADEMIYDNQNNQVTARGNVEIYYNNYTLLADKVIYNQATNTLSAKGNVRIKEPDGAEITADQITLTDDFRDGFIQSLKIVTSDDARIAASSAYRENGETTVFENAVYTPCKPCEDNPDKPPTWRIKAQRVIHKRSEATIAYENATFEMWGVPVAYLPRFSHADPSVKRKSGFLIPRFGHSNDLGFTTEIPYYFALAPNYDFTFSPLFTERNGVVVKGQWRQRTANGRYTVELAGIDQWDYRDISPGNQDFRGSVKTKGKFDINEFWSYGWDITAQTDDTFRRFYRLDNILTTEQVNDIHLTGISERNYFDARLYQFGALTINDTAAAESRVHPIIDYNYIYSDPVFGGEFSFDSNMMSLSSDDAADSNRLINELKWRRTLISPGGQILTPFFSARGDLYNVSNVVNPFTDELGEETNIARGMVTGGVEYRYPFVARTANAAHVIEPIGQFIARPDLGDQDDIPNEDALSLVFDDTLLFDIDKFSGYDRIESGTRANVGMRYTYQADGGGYVRAVVGQSYQVAGDNPFEFRNESGLRSTVSDYVTGLYIRPINQLSFVAQTRFDESTFEVKRTDLTSTVSIGPARGSATYSKQLDKPEIRGEELLEVRDNREEILANGSLNLTEFWSLIGSVRYDISRDQQVTDAIGLKYSDDCFALTVSYAQSFIQDRDIRPDETISLRFEFKHLGAFDIGSGGVGG